MIVLYDGAGAAAVANRQLLEPLRFLTLATVPRLELVGEPSPWKHIAMLAGLLGTCLTQAARLRPRVRPTKHAAFCTTCNATKFFFLVLGVSPPARCMLTFSAD